MPPSFREKNTGLQRPLGMGLRKQEAGEMEILQAMRVFVRVAELGSFTHAADMLQMGKSQVTRSVQELEESLGTRLLQRTTRSVRLTVEGEQFYLRAGEILASVTEAVGMFNEDGAALRGRLRLDIPPAFAQLAFIERLHGFHEAHPCIDLVLGVTDRAVDLVTEGVDCALRIGELPDSSLVARKIGSAVMVTCAAPGYLQTHGVPEDLAALAGHVGVRFLSGQNRRPMPWRFCVEGEEASVVQSGSIDVNESNAYVSCGVAGFGLIQAPGVLVAPHLASGRLVEVLADYRPHPWPVSILYPSRRHLAGPVQAFTHWLADHFVALDSRWLKA